MYDSIADADRSVQAREYDREDRTPFIRASLKPFSTLQSACSLISLMSHSISSLRGQVFCHSTFESLHQLHHDELKFSFPMITARNAKSPARNEVGFREKLLVCLFDGARLIMSSASSASEAYENTTSLSSIVLIPSISNGMQVLVSMTA
jgi:hypothetical protein